MSLEPNKKELLTSATKIARILYGYSKASRKWVLSKAKQILDEEPQSGEAT